MRKALIIGCQGQDGKLLINLLTEKHYLVSGVGRKHESKSDKLFSYLNFDLNSVDYDPVRNFINLFKPDEIYYLAAFHHSSQEIPDESFDFLNRTLNINLNGFVRILEISRQLIPFVKIIYTSSSLIFSGSNIQIQNENTTTQPECLYAASKCGAMEIIKYFKVKYGLFISTAIMYNHESIFRQDYFLSKSIINQTKQMLNGKITYIKIGNLSSISDWGYALDYVNALWHILQQKSPETYIVSSGIGRKVEEWFVVLFDYLDLDWKKYVVEENSIIVRNKNILIGDNSKLLNSGWYPKVSFNEMVIRMFNNKI